MNKFELQDGEYVFPYHYIPEYTKKAYCQERILRWGGQYLGYLLFVRQRLKAYGMHNVLDVGCGDGRFLRELSKDKFFEKLKGIDISERSIFIAKGLNPGICFEQQDIADEKEKWDAITCIECLEHIPDEQVCTFLNAIGDALAPGGRVFMTVPSVNLPLYPKHYRHYKRDVLQKELENTNLVIEDIAYICPLKTKLREQLYRLINNRFYCFKIVESIEWRRLWKHGFLAPEDRCEHMFAVLRKRETGE